ncbi:hypothetical protein C8Q79DRAFT_269 [Trametes meyenii]|nr:hypothetical protein C8Q79DRAFT_269 [Trametes meyenii]
MSFAGSTHRPRQEHDNPGNSSPISTNLYEPMPIDPYSTSSGAPSRTPSPSGWNTLTEQRYSMFDERNLSTDFDSETGSVGSAMSLGSPGGHEEIETNWLAQGSRNDSSASSSTRNVGRSPKTTDPFGRLPEANRGSGHSRTRFGESSDDGEEGKPRRTRIQQEQRRRDELRDGYVRLKEAVLPPRARQVKLSKPDLLERACNRIVTLERESMELHRRLAALEAERAKLDARIALHAGDGIFRKTDGSEQGTSV